MATEGSPSVAPLSLSGGLTTHDFSPHTPSSLWNFTVRLSPS